jgi:hypothetical protein
MAGLCYDTPHIEAMPFLIQEKSPYKPLAERFRRKICLLQAFIQEKNPLKWLLGGAAIRS